MGKRIIEISWTGVAIDVWRWLTDFYDIDIPAMPPLEVDMRKNTFTTRQDGTFSAHYGELKSSWRMFRDSGALVHYACHIYSRATIATIKRVWGTLAVPEEVYAIAMAHALCHEMCHFIRIIGEERKRLPSDEINVFVDSIGGTDDEYGNEALTLEAMKFYLLAQFGDTRYTSKSSAIAPRLYSSPMIHLGHISPVFRTMHETLIIMEYLMSASIRPDVISREGLDAIYTADGSFMANAVERHVKIGRSRRTKIRVIE